VELVAAASGFSDGLPSEFDGVPVRLFRARRIPKLGFSGIFSPELHNWLRYNLNKADVAHIHMGRDIVTLPAAVLASKSKVPYVLQTHGMVTASSHPLAGPVDRLWTIRALKRAKRILYLTPEEYRGLNGVAALGPTLQQLSNGVPAASSYRAPAERATEVLFLARLHPRKRPLLFVDLAKKLHPHFPEIQFVLAGPDGGQGDAVRKAIEASGISHVLRWEGAVKPDMTSQRLSSCDVYVLPSVDEPFPMSVLEALALGKPSVVTDSCGLAEYIASWEAGSVANSTLDSLVRAVHRLLADGSLRRQAGANAYSLATNEFSMSHVAARLEQVYEEAEKDG
jgi:glycosyltransferase involved in cell wall biosynthesis